MPRRKRSYLPGGFFHITARTHGGEFWFEELRSEIETIIETALKRTDAALVAYGLMTNHLHLIVRQGMAPLSQLMHPVCQRTAYAVHRRARRTGYVMDYRYFDTPCAEQSHLRNAIVYVHRNPVEAGMCSDARAYVWSSDSVYRSVSSGRIAALRPVTELFASGLSDRTAQQDYADYYAWYDACKNVGADELKPLAPGVTAGDEYWQRNYGSSSASNVDSTPDLGDVVKRALAQAPPDVSLELIRTGVRTRRVSAIRRLLIERALRVHHRPIDVAQFLNTSPTTVSNVRASLTW
jgi:REP element-mobilizing transposase RayT